MGFFFNYRGSDTNIGLLLRRVVTYEGSKKQKDIQSHFQLLQFFFPPPLKETKSTQFSNSICTIFICKNNHLNALQ